MLVGGFLLASVFAPNCNYGRRIALAALLFRLLSQREIKLLKDFEHSEGNACADVTAYVWQAKEELRGDLTFLLFDGTSDVKTKQTFAGNWFVDAAVDTSFGDYGGFPAGSFPAAICTILREFAPRHKNDTKADIRRKVQEFIRFLQPGVCKFGEGQNQNWNMPLLAARCWLVCTGKGKFGRRVVTPANIGVDANEIDATVPQLIFKAEVDGAVASNDAAVAIELYLAATGRTGSSTSVHAVADVAGGDQNTVLLQQLEQLEAEGEEKDRKKRRLTKNIIRQEQQAQEQEQQEQHQAWVAWAAEFPEQAEKQRLEMILTSKGVGELRDICKRYSVSCGRSAKVGIVAKLLNAGWTDNFIPL
jgi:hypothetical protein